MPVASTFQLLEPAILLFLLVFLLVFLLLQLPECRLFRLQTHLKSPADNLHLIILSDGHCTNLHQ
jgi:hypothetical protein